MEEETAAGSVREGALVRAQSRQHARSSCSFCSFVLAIYPTLTGLTKRDTLTFKAHLERTHGLVQGIDQ